jgi:tetratricopeptide (TPR) repeat protein
MGYGEALYYARRYREAGEVFGKACTTTPNTPACLGWAGLVKARSGQRQEALALKEAIGKTDSTPRRRVSDQAYWQARIAAVVGDRDGAVDLFRRAYTYGWTHSADDHREYDFHALLDDPPFKELLKPKG